MTLNLLATDARRTTSDLLWVADDMEPSEPVKSVRFRKTIVSPGKYYKLTILVFECKQIFLTSFRIYVHTFKILLHSHILIIDSPGGTL